MKAQRFEIGQSVVRHSPDGRVNDATVFGAVYGDGQGWLYDIALERGQYEDLVSEDWLSEADSD